MRVERTHDLATCLSIRRKVFIEGQGVPEAEEVDGLDPDCLHYLGHVDGQAIATLRVKRMGRDAKLQRVAVLQQMQGAGHGAALIRFVLEDLRGTGIARVILGSQTHALGFYEKLGFAAHGPVYDDAGIPHRDMSLPL